MPVSCPVGFQRNGAEWISICKATERGDAVASSSEVNAADENSGKSIGEISMGQDTSVSSDGQDMNRSVSST